MRQSTGPGCGESPALGAISRFPQWGVRSDGTVLQHPGPYKKLCIHSHHDTYGLSRINSSTKTRLYGSSLFKEVRYLCYHRGEASVRVKSRMWLAMELRCRSGASKHRQSWTHCFLSGFDHLKPRVPVQVICTTVKLLEKLHSKTCAYYPAATPEARDARRHQSEV